MKTEPILIDWLKGQRILLIAHYVPGPTAAYLLRVLGAEVIKVEPPFHDMLRMFPPFIEGPNSRMAAMFRTLNAGFRSIVIDFKTVEGQQILKGLLQKCDVLIDGNRPGYLESVLGKPISEAAPEIIHIPISAHGLKGPMRDVAGHDNNVFAMSGNLSYTSPGEAGMPSVFSAPLADINSGYMAAFLAVSALLGRENTQAQAKVRTVDASMLHAAFFLNQMQVSSMNVVPEAPEAGKAWMNGGMANYTSYNTGTGEAIFFGPVEPGLFQNFCRATGREELNKLLYADNEKLKNELTQLFAGKSLAEWEELLKDVDCCFSPVKDLKQALENEQIRALGLVQELDDDDLGPIRLVGFPAGFGPDSRPPELPNKAPKPDEDREYILALLGKE